MAEECAVAGRLFADGALPVIGMLHAPPLPGAPRARGSLAAVEQFVLHDAEALAAGGVQGLLLENFGDAPFYPRATPPWVVAGMACLAAAVRRRFDLPLGINVLRNDGRAALGVAIAAGAEFIRVNVLCGARVTDQGVLVGAAHRLLRARQLLRAEHVQILADVAVKHSAPLGPGRPLADEARETLERGGADALIVSGTATGQAVDRAALADVRAAVGRAAVYIGSGASAANVAALAPLASGFIVGTALKAGESLAAAVDERRVREFVQAVAAARQSGPAEPDLALGR